MVSIRFFYFLIACGLSLNTSIALAQTAQWWYEQAEQQARQSKELNLLQAAFRMYNKAIELNPVLAEAMVGRAKVRLKWNDKDGALTDLTQAIIRKDTLTEAYFERGKIYLSQHKNAQAITDFTKVLTLNPYFFQVYEFLAEGYANMQKNDLARSFYQKAYEFNPDRLEIIDKYANFTQNILQDYPKTIELMNRIIQKINNEPSYFIRRGTAYHAAKMHEKAIADYNQVIRLMPQDGTAYYYRGLAYSNVGKFSEACKDIRQSYNLGFEQAKNLLDKHCK